MTSKIISLGLAAVASVAFTVATAQEVTVETPTVKVAEAKTTSEGGWVIAGVKFVNPLDASTWYDAAESEMHTADVKINFADPDFWMQLPSPEAHTQVHTAILNPETWAQFVKPETYVAMADPKVLVKWFKPSTYSVMIDPQTYAYRMQPGAFLHLIDVDSYAQLMNPTAYMTIMSAAVDTAMLVMETTTSVIVK